MLIASQQESWAGGVNTSVQPDQIPPTCSPRAYNTALAFTGNGEAIISKRRGMSVMNATPITSTPAILGGAEFRKLSGGAFTAYTILCSDAGRVDAISTSGVLSEVDAAGLTAGTHFPSFAVLNNLIFVVNGQDRKKYDGTSWTNFGIAAPGTAPTLAAGAAGTPNGTYQCRVTFFNSSTGTESSAGPTSANQAVASQILAVSAIPTSADTQVTSRKIYIRNTVTQTNFYLAGTISDNVTTTFNFNAADSTLITLGPDTAENDRPPSGIKYLASHRGRVFAADDTTLYYSKPNKPENFDPDFAEPIFPSDGQKITGIHAAHDILLIFKTNALYGLFGDSPNDWVVRLIDPDVGCTSFRSIRSVEGRTFWWSEQGPVQFSGEGRPELIGLPVIATTISSDNLNFAQLDIICAEVDFPRQRIMFAVPGVSQTKNTLMLPFNYRLGVWESDKWDPMDVSCLFTSQDGNGQPWVFVGNYEGQVFKWWNADHDGVASGTTSGTFIASGTSVTTVTDLTAAFDTTGGGLVERKVTILDSNGRAIGSTRQKIASNNATSFTLGTAVQGLTNLATYTYIIGGPFWEFDTKWEDHDLPFVKKRFEFFNAQMAATSENVTVTIDLAFNFDTSSGQAKALTFVTSAPDATWDASLWDSASYGTQAQVPKRLRVGRTGRSWRARFRNYYPSQSVSLLKVAMRGSTLGTKLG